MQRGTPPWLATETQGHGENPISLWLRDSVAKGSRRNKFTFWRERRAGRCEAPRRRRCRTSSRSGNKADARPPPRPFGLRPAGPLALLLAPHIPPRYSSSLAPRQRAWGPAAKCEVISAQALRALAPLPLDPSQ